MARINTYPNDIPITLNDKMVGTETGSDNTKNYPLIDVLRLFSINGTGLIITEYDVDDVGSLYDYHGGTIASGSWLITRYLKTNISDKKYAVEAENVIYTNLTDAWTNRLTLTYNT